MAAAKFSDIVVAFQYLVVSTATHYIPPGYHNGSWLYNTKGPHGSYDTHRTVVAVIFFVQLATLAINTEVVRKVFRLNLVRVICYALGFIDQFLGASG